MTNHFFAATRCMHWIIISTPPRYVSFSSSVNDSNTCSVKSSQEKKNGGCTLQQYVANKTQSIKVAQSSFQHLYWMGRYNHSLSLDATTMVSKNFSIIVEHVAIIFLTQ